MADDITELSVAIVNALSAWSSVEIQLSQLFGILADMQDVRDNNLNPKALAVFDAIISFGTRRTVIDALMAHEGLTPLEAQTWRLFSARLMKLYKRRHELAHFVFSGTPIDLKQNPVQLNYAVAPFFTLSSAMKRQFKSLTADQIKERADHFAEMTQGIGYLTEQAKMRRGQQLNNPMPEPPRVTLLREAASRKLEELARRPEPSDPLCDQDDD
jgi:hypothetical protein